MIDNLRSIINLVDNAPNQPSKFRTKGWVEINNESRVTYNQDNLTSFKTSVLCSSLFDYSDANLLVKRIITVGNTAVQDQYNNGTGKKVKFKNCAPFTNCISRMNNAQVDDASYIDVEMPMYDLTEYSDNYVKTFEFYGNFIELHRL